MSENKKHGSNVALIRKYFGMTASEGMAEIKPISAEERQEIGDMIREEIDAGRFTL